MEIFGLDVPSAADGRPYEAPNRSTGSYPMHELYRIAIARQISWVAPVISAAFERNEWATAEGIEETIDAAIAVVMGRATAMAALARTGLPQSEMTKAYLPVAARMMAHLIRQTSTPTQLHMRLQRIEAQDQNSMSLRLVGLGQAVARWADTYPAPRPGADAGMQAAVPAFIAEMLGPDIIPGEPSIPDALPIVERLVGEVVDISVRQAADIRKHTPDEHSYTVPSVFRMCARIMLTHAAAIFRDSAPGLPDGAAVDAAIRAFRHRAGIACAVLARRVESYVSANSPLPPSRDADRQLPVVNRSRERPDTPPPARPAPSQAPACESAPERSPAEGAGSPAMKVEGGSHARPDGGEGSVPERGRSVGAGARRMIF